LVRELGCRGAIADEDGARLASDLREVAEAVAPLSTASTAVGDASYVMETVDFGGGSVVEGEVSDAGDLFVDVRRKTET
jgi:hypothetical protein